MILFWSIALTMVLVALAMVVFPLFRSKNRQVRNRREQNVKIAQQRLEELMADLIRGDLTRDEYTQARTDLEQALYDDLEGLEETPGAKAKKNTWVAAIIIVAFPLTAIWLYLTLGTPQAINSIVNQEGSASPPNVPSAQSPASIQQMAQRLRDRLLEQPDDVDGWLMLARTYKVMGQFDDAARVMEHVYKHVGDEPTILVQYADTLAMRDQGKLQGKALELVNKALAKDPNHPTGLWLAGMGAAEAGDFQTAVSHWNKLEPLLTEKPEALQRVKELISSAQRQLGGKTDALVADAGQNEQNKVATRETNVSVLVNLGPSLVGQVEPTDSLFIYAQALSGPPMPLAVVRKTVRDLPIRVVLNDNLAMIPSMKISKFEQVRIGARISKSGNPIAQSGDFEGKVEPVQVGNSDVVNITITNRVP